MRAGRGAALEGWRRRSQPGGRGRGGRPARALARAWSVGGSSVVLEVVCWTSRGTARLRRHSPAAPRYGGPVMLELMDSRPSIGAARVGPRASDVRCPREPSLTRTDSTRHLDRGPIARTSMAPALRGPTHRISCFTSSGGPARPSGRCNLNASSDLRHPYFGGWGLGLPTPHTHTPHPTPPWP